MKITKHLAQVLAKQLLKEKRTKQESLYQNLIERVSQAYQETVPSEIKEAYAKHKSFFRGDQLCYGKLAQKSFYVKGPGHVGSSSFVLSDEHDMELLLLSQADNALRSLKERTEAILLSLGTKARVIEQFPELEPYFPKPTSGNGSLVPAAIEQLKAEIAG